MIKLHAYHGKINAAPSTFADQLVSFDSVKPSQSHLYYRVLVDGEMMDNVSIDKMLVGIGIFQQIFQQLVDILWKYDCFLNQQNNYKRKKRDPIFLRSAKVGFTKQVMHLVESLFLEMSQSSVSHLIGALVHRAVKNGREYTWYFTNESHFNHGMLYNQCCDSQTGVLESKPGYWWKSKYGMDACCLMSAQALTYEWYEFMSHLAHFRLMLYDQTITLKGLCHKYYVYINQWMKLFEYITMVVSNENHMMNQWHGNISNLKSKERILTKSDIKQLQTPAEKKRVIGEVLFPKIQKHEPRLAGKILGMLLECKNDELLAMQEDETLLTNSINQAIIVLAQHETDKKNQQ